MGTIILGIVLISFLVWLGLCLDPDRRWHFNPVDDGSHDGEKLAGKKWPSVVIVVPARNESEVLPDTLPSLLKQEYPGTLHLLLVDDGSTDGTSETARKVAEACGQSERLLVMRNESRPEGWMGKVWAMDRGIREAVRSHNPDFVLLTDADILHSGDSCRNLVAQSSVQGLALNSRMARLRCSSFAEQLLIPAFVYFFNLMYPMHAINNPRRSPAGAAGGCVLLSKEAIEKLGGGFESIRSCVIDDCNLARAVKGQGLPIFLSLSRHRVTSLRDYPEVADIWAMVTRSAYAELKYNPARLLIAVAGLFCLFVAPWLAILLGAAQYSQLGLQLVILGAGCLVLQAVTYRPAVRFFGLSPWRVWSLSAAGMIYGMMTVDSARRHWMKRGVVWRG